MEIKKKVINGATVEYGHTFDEYDELYGLSYDDGELWDFSKEDFTNGAIEPRKNMIYWSIKDENGNERFYETDIIEESCKVRKEDKEDLDEERLDEGTSNFGTGPDNFPLLVFYTIDEFYDMMRYDPDCPQEEDFEKEDENGHYYIDDEAYEDAREEFEQKYWDENNICVLDEDQQERLEDALYDFNNETQRIAENRYAEENTDDYYDLKDVKLNIEPGYYSAAYIDVEHEDYLEDLSDGFREEQYKRFEDFFKKIKEELGLTHLSAGPAASDGTRGYSIVKEDKEEPLEEKKKKDKGIVATGYDLEKSTSFINHALGSDCATCEDYDDLDKYDLDSYIKDDDVCVYLFPEGTTRKDIAAATYHYNLKYLGKVEDTQEGRTYIDIALMGKYSDLKKYGDEYLGGYIMHPDYIWKEEEWEEMGPLPITEDWGDNQNKKFTINVKNGLYIGDLCYALDNDVYYGIWGGNDFEDGEYYTDDGLEFAMVGTAYGDGNYDGDDGHHYPVDAGIIGICDADLATKDRASELGRIIPNVTGKVTISYDNGTITIKTNCPYPDNEINIYTDESVFDESLKESEEVARVEYCVMDKLNNNIECFDNTDDAIAFAKDHEGVRVLEVKYGPKDEHGDEDELSAEEVWSIRESLDETIKDGKPYFYIKFWEDEERRDQGESDIFMQEFETKEEAIKQARKLVDRDGFASVEVFYTPKGDVNENDDELVFGYDGVDTWTESLKESNKKYALIVNGEWYSTHDSYEKAGEAKDRLLDACGEDPDTRKYYGIYPNVEIREIDESLTESMKSEVTKWWNDVEDANIDMKWGFRIDNGNYDDVEAMHAAMFDMLDELKEKGAFELFKQGKKIYNKYAKYSKYNDGGLLTPYDKDESLNEDTTTLKDGTEIDEFDSYEEAHDYLVNYAKENNIEHYAIVEDSYEVPHGLLFIEYDETGEEKSHYPLVSYKNEALEDPSDGLDRLRREMGRKFLPPQRRPKKRYYYELYWYADEDEDGNWLGDPIFKKFPSMKAAIEWYNAHKEDKDKFGMNYPTSWSENESLKEAGKTSAQKYNNKLDAIFRTYKDTNDKMANFLLDKGVSQEEVDDLKKNTGLGDNALLQKIIELGVKDEFFNDDKRECVETYKAWSIKADPLKEEVTILLKNKDNVWEEFAQVENCPTKDMLEEDIVKNYSTLVKRVLKENNCKILKEEDLYCIHLKVKDENGKVIKDVDLDTCGSKKEMEEKKKQLEEVSPEDSYHNRNFYSLRKK